MTTKKEQRAILKEKIMAFKDAESASHSIQDKLFGLEEYQNSKSIFIYISTDAEADTSNIINDALKSNKKVFVPIMQDNGKIAMSEINFATVYKKGVYNIMQPEIPIIAEEKTDIAIIPLVGFDKEKNRLGHGKGYYDKFLRDYDGKKIALAFAVQEVDKLVVEDFDIKMDTIITEEKIF